jgi:hypothetical protein
MNERVKKESQVGVLPKVQHLVYMLYDQPAKKCKIMIEVFRNDILKEGVTE